ncbi:hypothetical protein NGF19_16155, partial [Streptomyces sp. RY43-2]|nr:hypothetical protein [Streptomyces macrolidinus]
MHRSERTRSAFLIRLLTPMTLAWIFVGAPAGAASADACAYASTGPDGPTAVAVAGGHHWPLPPCRTPSPTPPP